MRYLVKAQGGFYCFFHKDGGLWWCGRDKDGSWSEPACFYKSGVDYFTVSLCEGKILILCQTKTKVEQIYFDRGDFESSVLVEGGLDGNYYGLALGLDTFLVHNMPIAREYSHILMSHRVDAQGLWTNSRNLGRVIPLGRGYPFDIVPIEKQHFLLFYQAQGDGFGGDLGYREVYGKMMGDFNVVHSNANINGKCHSFLATTEGIHMVYMTKGLLVPSLNYVKKDTRGLSSKISLAQGHNVHSPLLYMLKGRLHLLYMRGEDVFSCVIGRDGYVSNPQLQQEGFKAGDIVLGRFLCENEADAEFLANELPVNSKKPWEVVFLDNLLNLNSEPGAPVKQYKTSQIGSQDDYNDFFNQGF